MGKTKFENSLVRMKGGGGKEKREKNITVTARVESWAVVEGCREEYPFLIW